MTVNITHVTSRLVSVGLTQFSDGEIVLGLITTGRSWNMSIRYRGTSWTPVGIRFSREHNLANAR